MRFNRRLALASALQFATYQLSGLVFLDPTVMVFWSRCPVRGG